MAIPSLPGDRLFAQCLALSHLVLADDGLIESEHEADCRTLPEHLESTILLWCAERGAEPAT
jgi:hypothetical protein